MSKRLIPLLLVFLLLLRVVGVVRDVRVVR